MHIQSSQYYTHNISEDGIFKKTHNFTVLQFFIECKSYYDLRMKSYTTNNVYNYSYRQGVSNIYGRQLNHSEMKLVESFRSTVQLVNESKLKLWKNYVFRLPIKII